MRIETLAVHAGHATDPATGAIAPAIQLSTTFERAPDGTYPTGYSYTRNDNPNRHALEVALAAIEGGTAAAAFASGIAATAAIFQALQPGDHVIAPIDVYHGATHLLRERMLPWGLQAAFVDMSDLDAVQNAIAPQTKVIWIETPSNPQLTITDIAEVARVAHEAGAVCVCDNTWAPIIQRPLALGADFALHSTTKYISGHSDVMGGAIVAREASGLFERIRVNQAMIGGVPSPFDCWFTARGLRTLPWRLRAHCDNAFAIAKFLAAHPRVERVAYPGLTSHPGHEIAARQMSSFGGMLSFVVRGGAEAAIAVAAKTKIFTRATSLGGVESLIEHRASITGESPLTPPGLLRASIGIEHFEDLIEDLSQALGS